MHRFFRHLTIMVAMLGACWVVSAKKLWSQLIAAMVLGIGVGAAASGKYVGAAVLARNNCHKGMSKLHSALVRLL